jgi:hypothetical protein
MNQKIKQQGFLKYLWLLQIQKKVKIGSGSGPRRPDPDPAKKVQIRPDPDPQHWSQCHCWNKKDSKKQAIIVATRKFSLFLYLFVGIFSQKNEKRFLRKF